MQDNIFDTVNLRQSANFEVPISKNLFWVPINRLGDTRYPQARIMEMVSLPAKEKKNLISNVYEAIQLLQSCNFNYYSGAACHGEMHDELFWVHHKPGYISMITNTGCCTDLATWMDYLIEDFYPNRGYLWYFRPDGSSHILNYIYHQGFYYLLDTTAMLAEKAIHCSPETGCKTDYIHSQYPTGICFKCNELSDFVRYHARVQKFHNHSFLYVDLPSFPAIPPTSISTSGDGINVFFSFSCRVIKEALKIRYFYKEPFQYSPNWHSI